MTSQGRQAEPRNEPVSCPECGWEIPKGDMNQHYRIIHTE